MIDRLNDNNPFLFGYGSGGYNGILYVKEKIYSIRVYNKFLSDEECTANYNATVSYHNILVNGGNASTGGNTGGEDFGNIETN